MTNAIYGTYIGTKMVRATQMNRLDYNTHRGWAVPANENPNDEGYLVEYLDGGPANHPEHNGYISWSPKEQFEAAYNNVFRGLTFGHALVALEAGERVCRRGWNGKGMWLNLVAGGANPVTSTDYTIETEDPLMDGLTLLPWIGMKTADGGFVPWLASQTDMQAKDWLVVTDESEHSELKADLSSLKDEPSTDTMTQEEAMTREATDNAPETQDVTWDAELRFVPNSPQIVGNCMSGLIFSDKQERFIDGLPVTTSRVMLWDAENSIATTRSGTRYKVEFETDAVERHG